MELSVNYESILILSIFAFITPIFLSRFKKVNIPSVVGEILVGIIIGNSFLNLVVKDVPVVLLSNLGLAFLMFLSGLEIEIDALRTSLSKAKKIKLSTLSISIIMFILSLSISFCLSLILYKNSMITNVALYTLLFASSAPGLIVPFLKERNLLNTEFGQVLLVYSLIGEFVCLISITILCGAIVNGLSYKSFLFVIVFIVSFLIYLGAKIMTKFNDFSSFRFKNNQIEVRAAFALILTLVFVSNMVKSEIVLGAFLAGIIFSLIFKGGKKELIYKFDVIGFGFTIPIFFIMVGVSLELGPVFSDVEALLMVPVYLILLFIIKIIPTLLLIPYFGINKSISAGILLSSQLSIMIVGAQIALNSNIINSNSYSILILTTIISCLLFPYMFDRFFKIEDVVILKKKGIERVCIQEIIITNKKYLNKPLKDVKFPDHCRVFLILRDGEEILPNGETIIRDGDKVVLAGLDNPGDVF
ncbi:MAG: cation:proton antiporter [Clostridiaceae bacterium]